jgi:phosphatidate phosphatase PAH1
MDFYHVNAHEFKYNTLEKYVLQPFVDVGATIHQIFHAGFGNTLYDMHAYHRAGIEAHRMFIIDKQSRIHACNASLITSSQNKDESKQKAMTLDHPKQYESMKGTMFATGYLDPNLMTYILNLQY